VNVADALRTASARLPDKAALLIDGAGVSFAELDQQVDRAAAGFQRLGLVPGDRVALLLGNVPEFVVALYATLRAGLTAVPVNVTFTAPEVSHVLRDSGARVAVAASELSPMLESLRGEVPSLETVVATGGTRWEELAGTAEEPAPVETGPDALALLQYTSGTTGHPRGAMLTHHALIANQDQMGRTRLRVEERDVVLCVLPLFHIYGLNVALAFTLSRGATALLVPRFDAIGTLREITAHRASIIVGAPPMYTAWSLTPEAAQFDLGSVRYAVSGAAPLPVEVLERFQADFGVAIWEGYGLTETAPVLTSNAMRDTPLPGSVGRTVPGVELRLLDAAGRPAPEGDPGEVTVRGPNVFSGYWQAPEATAAVLDADGWFRTGDVGYLDGQDLFLVDRKKDLIIVSGFNVYPREVEEVLYRHPAVAEAAVIGMPHLLTGEAVKAIVVLREGAGATAEDIEAHCRTSLARFKCPHQIEFAESLPLLPSGKVKRRDLRGS